MPALARPIDDSYQVPDATLFAGEYPGVDPLDPSADLGERLGRFLHAGITAFVDLTTPDDPVDPYEPALRRVAAEAGVQVTWERFGIPDVSTCDARTMRRILDTIDGHLAQGRSVYIHCKGGIGRTGMVVGCWLVRHGRSGDEALAEVVGFWASMPKSKAPRHRGRTSPETRAQQAVVHHWSEPAGREA